MARSPKSTGKTTRHSSLENWIENYPTRLGVYFPLFGALGVIVIGTWLGTLIYHAGPPAKYEDLVFFVACLVGSLTGWIQISLREVHGLILPVRGKAAVVWGGLWIAVWCGLALLALWDYFAGPVR